jgi:hypothetical protein
VAVGQDADEPYPPAQAQRQNHANSHEAGQCGQVQCPRHVEHVFVHQKNRFGLFIRTIGLKRAEAKLTMANLAYNFNILE